MILDYGSGKGKQYDPQVVEDGNGGKWPGMVDYWEVDEVVCYDPAYAPYSRLPDGTFDGVICTDVLEHCPEEDVPWIVAEMYSRARSFVFASIACYPAKTHLPNGENAHCTIRSVEWWNEMFTSTAHARPEVVYRLHFDQPVRS
jgi:hypothetical protein